MTETIYETVRLRGVFTARSPISHIGEVVSTTAYLSQDPVVQPDGTVAEVFSYSGNGWRGQLRDIMARRVAEAVGARLPIDTFHLLFSGGRIEQDKGVDLDAARTIRAAVPMVSLLGGGIGSQILQGKLRVFNSYPICREAKPVLPARLHAEADTRRYGAMTFEKEFTRRDDGRFDDGRLHLGSGADADSKPKKGKPQSDQMRMGVELVAPGTRLYTEIHGSHLTRVELGCLVAALWDFGMSPCIGGQGSKGHGLVDLRYALAGSVEADPFVEIEDGIVILSDLAKDVLGEFEEHLDEQATSMREVLKCA